MFYRAHLETGMFKHPRRPYCIQPRCIRTLACNGNALCKLTASLSYCFLFPLPHFSCGEQTAGWFSGADPQGSPMKLSLPHPASTHAAGAHQGIRQWMVPERRGWAGDLA